MAPFFGPRPLADTLRHSKVAVLVTISGAAALGIGVFVFMVVDAVVGVVGVCVAVAAECCRSMSPRVGWRQYRKKSHA
jgi:hypothetical protein